MDAAAKNGAKISSKCGGGKLAAKDNARATGSASADGFVAARRGAKSGAAITKAGAVGVAPKSGAAAVT